MPATVGGQPGPDPKECLGGGVGVQGSGSEAAAWLAGAWEAWVWTSPAPCGIGTTTGSLLGRPATAPGCVLCHGKTSGASADGCPMLDATATIPTSVRSRHTSIRTLSLVGAGISSPRPEAPQQGNARSVTASVHARAHRPSSLLYSLAYLPDVDASFKPFLRRAGLRPSAPRPSRDHFHCHMIAAGGSGLGGHPSRDLGASTWPQRGARCAKRTQRNGRRSAVTRISGTGGKLTGGPEGRLPASCSARHSSWSCSPAEPSGRHWRQPPASSSAPAWPSCWQGPATGQVGRRPLKEKP
jgi:hypothetical protein